MSEVSSEKIPDCTWLGEGRQRGGVNKYSEKLHIYTHRGWMGRGSATSWKSSVAVGCEKAPHSPA